MKLKLYICLLALIFGITMLIYEVNPTPNIDYNFKELSQIKIYPVSKLDYINNTQLIYNKVLEIANNIVNSHTYELRVFDCTDFSMELVKRLNKEGIKAQCTAGYNYQFDYPAHTWVSVWIKNNRIEIEATQGYIISSDDYKNYEVKWEDYCW